MSFVQRSKEFVKRGWKFVAKSYDVWVALYFNNERSHLGKATLFNEVTRDSN